MPMSDKIEESALVLQHEIEKLDRLGLTFAASLVRIAHLDLQMRIHGATEKDIDLLSFVVNFVEQHKAGRPGSSKEVRSGRKKSAGERKGAD